MNRALHIARREWLEQRRQPVMVGVILATNLVIGGVAASALALLHQALVSAEVQRSLAPLLPAGVEVVAMLTSASAGVLQLARFLLFSQLLGIAGVLAGHAMLHDRQTHTLPFLLLAPVRRGELVLGKVLGAAALPVGAYWLGAGLLFAVSAALGGPGLGDGAGGAAAWLRHLVGVPCWTVAVCAAGALVSSAVRDVRTAQQSVWFILLFATLGLGWLLEAAGSDLGAQAAVAGLGALSAGTLLWVGGQAIRRDLGR